MAGAFIQQYLQAKKINVPIVFWTPCICLLFALVVCDHVVLLTATAALTQEHLIKQVLIDT